LCKGKWSRSLLRLLSFGEIVARKSSLQVAFIKSGAVPKKFKSVIAFDHKEHSNKSTGDKPIDYIFPRL
jgi:hypothetical protein